MGDLATLFRLVGASALVGLLAYCGCHIVQVWRKRNAKATDPSAGVRGTRRLAWVCLLAGLVLIQAAVVVRELTHTEGILTGEDLFVVRATDDMVVQWLQDRDSVAADEPLARFGSGPRSARVEELGARLARAEAERDVLALLPLTPDPELTRRHQGVSQERAQVQQELGQAVAAAEASDRDLNAQVLTKKEALARLERTLTERRKDLERTTLKCAHASKMLATYAELRTRGTITAAEYQEQQKVQKDAEVELAALAQELKDGLAEKAILRNHLEKLEAVLAAPTAPLRTQEAALRTRLARLEGEEKELKTKLEQDLARSTRLREAERAQAEAKVREQRAGLAGLVGDQEVRAPFAGRIAYRAASPNATRPRSPLVVLGPENGFLLTARLPRAEADALRDGGEVAIEVGEDGPERRIPARFKKAAALAHEPDQAALQLECQPPPEVVRRLAEGEKLTVAFSWHPPLTGMWGFRVGILLSAAGLIGLVLTRPRIAAKVRTLAPWRGPSSSWAQQGMDGLASHSQESLREVGGQAESVAVLATSHPRRRVTDRVTVVDADIPDSLDALDAACRESLERLNRANCPQEAARLLSRLHRLRRALRSLDPSGPDSLSPADGESQSVLVAGS